VDGSIGSPARVIFGDLETSDIAMDVPSDRTGRKAEDYLVRRESQAILTRTTQEFVKKNQRKRAADGREKVKKGDQI